MLPCGNSRLVMGASIGVSILEHLEFGIENVKK